MRHLILICLFVFAIVFSCLSYKTHANISAIENMLVQTNLTLVHTLDIVHKIKDNLDKQNEPLRLANVAPVRPPRS